MSDHPKECTTDNLLCNCLYFTANSLARSITRMAEECFHTTGLSPSHAFLMLLVNENPGITPKELAAQLHLAPSTVTRFVDALERRGYLTRKSEGKVSHILPTAAGKALKEPIAAAWKDLFHRYSRILGEDAGIELTRVLYEAGTKLDSR